MNHEVQVLAVGLAAPGLSGWSDAQKILRGEAPYAEGEQPLYQPSLLPQNERRRAPPAVRQAFRAAEEAVAALGRPASDLAAVFASSDADMGIIHRICSALSAPIPAISPTDFHNSVHNAAAGYWSIAAQARGPSTTLSAYDASFTAGLLEAMATVVVEGWDTLLVAYDMPPPFPLSAERTIGGAVSVALVLGRGDTRPLARLRLECIGAGAVTPMQPPQLERLRSSNPAARALPLLQALACGRPDTLFLDNSGGGMLKVEVNPSSG